MQRVFSAWEIKQSLVVTEVALDKSEYREPKGSGTKICSTAIMVFEVEIERELLVGYEWVQAVLFPYLNTTVFKI